MKRNLTYKIVPKIMLIPLFVAVAYNSVAYWGSRLLTSWRFHHNFLEGRIEGKIPVVSWTVIIYFGAYLFWIANYIIGCRQDKEEAFRLMSADFLAKTVCLILFILFPTTNTRPLIEGHSVFDEMMRFLYRIDAADNLFPSIHCLTSYFCFIAVRKNKNVPKWYRVVSFLLMISICISTLTTKQHVLFDVFAGIALAEACYVFTKKWGFSKLYSNVILGIYDKIAVTVEGAHE